MTDTFDNVQEDEIIIDNIPAVTSKSADDEALESLWNRFNTADDKYTLYVERAILNQKKTVSCFNTEVTGDFDSVIEQCRSEWIPIGDQKAEFIFRVMDVKIGKWAIGGNKRMWISLKNSDMKRSDNPNQSEFMSMVSRTLEKQNEQNMMLMERMWESNKKESSNVLHDLLASPAVIAILPAVVAKILEKPEPVQQPQPTSMTELMQNMVVMKEFLGGGEKDASEESMTGIVSNVVKAFGVPIGQLAATLQERQRLAPPAPKQPDTTSIDNAVMQENQKRENTPKQLQNVPEDGKQAQELLTSVIKMALKGAINGAPPEMYADVIIDQLEIEQFEEFVGFVDDPTCFSVICLIEPDCAEHEEWFNKLISHISSELKEALDAQPDEQLTSDNETAIVSENSGQDIGANDASSQITIDEHTIGNDGDESHLKQDEGTS